MRFRSNLLVKFKTPRLAVHDGEGSATFCDAITQAGILAATSNEQGVIGLGHRRSRYSGSILRADLRLHQYLQQTIESRSAMLVDYILGGGVTLFLLAYLTYALVRPERF